MGFPCNRCCNKCKKVNQPNYCSHGVYSNDNTGTYNIIHTAYSGVAEGSLNYQLTQSGVSTWNYIFKFRNEFPAPAVLPTPNYEHTGFTFTGPNCEIDLTDQGVESIRIDLLYSLRTYIRITPLIEQDGVFYSISGSHYDNYGGTGDRSYQSVFLTEGSFREIISYNWYGTTPSQFNPGACVVDQENGATPDFSKGASPLKVHMLCSWWGNWVSAWNTPPYTGNPADQGDNAFTIKQLCITAKYAEEECDINIYQLGPYDPWFRGPQRVTLGTGNPDDGYDTVNIYFTRHYGSLNGRCNQYLYLTFDHEDSDGYRYFISEPYETRDNTTAYLFARHHRCKSYVNCWISTDPTMFAMPSSCSDSSNYLPIWDNGVEEDDNFNPDSPVDPIYIFGHDTDGSFDHTNWQGRMLALNFPKRFYRVLDKIEVRHLENLWTSGTIEVRVPDYYLPLTCGSSLGNGLKTIGSAGSADWDDWPAYNLQRGHACFYWNGQEYYSAILGSNWPVKQTNATSYNCPISLGLFLYWINQQTINGPYHTSEGPDFILMLGYGFTVGEFEGTLTEDWTDFVNNDPITKSGGGIYGGGWGYGFSGVIDNLVMGTFQAKGIFLEVF